MNRKNDAKRYVELNPAGEAKTIKVGYTKFWRCRPIKNVGPWHALPTSAAMQDIPAGSPRADTRPPPPEVRMTEAERYALSALATAEAALVAAIPNVFDRKEAADAIHVAQRLVMIQATIRSEPGFFGKR